MNRGRHEQNGEWVLFLKSKVFWPLEYWKFRIFGGIIRYPLPAHLQLLNNSNNKIIFIIPETSVAVYYRCVIIMDSIQVVLVVNNTFTAIQQLWFLK
jgi:lipid-A-disaccharide synthase-like uncharacterized protein